MPSWSNPLTHSSNLSFTLTSTHTHHQHISPHRHLPNCIQAGYGNPTAQKKQSLKPCELQKRIPNHQFSFCWIYLLLLTLLTIRSSWPPSHHWASQGFHFAGLNPNGRSLKVAWGGEVSTEHQLVTGVPQGSVHWPLLFSTTYTTSLGPIIQAHGFSYHCYADDTQLYLSFQPDDPTVAARISGCLADISAWMKEHHLQLKLAKTELLVFPATPTLQHDFTIQLGSSTITPSSLVRNLGVIFDDQLTFKDHIAKTARSCWFALHNIRKIRPFLTEHAAQLLVQVLVISRLDYCNALLAGLPSCTIKPLQMIQNAAAWLVFCEHKRAHVTPLFISLHWLPTAARIKFKTLMIAYRTATGLAPTYFHSLMTIYIPFRSLRSASERRLVVPMNSEQCLDICITSISCVCLPLFNVSLIVFLNCKLLWIKVSAKLMNVNVNVKCKR